MLLISPTELPRLLGIKFLTGEACAYSMRTLCDLNEDGAALVSDFLGIKHDGFTMRSISTVGSKPAIYSVMIPREMFPPLARFALFRKGYQYVYGDPATIDYCAFNDSDLEKYPALQTYIDGGNFGNPASVLHRNPRNPAAAEGSRNVHQFTGRTA